MESCANKLLKKIKFFRCNYLEFTTQIGCPQFGILCAIQEGNTKFADASHFYLQLFVAILTAHSKAMAVFKFEFFAKRRLSI